MNIEPKKIAEIIKGLNYIIPALPDDRNESWLEGTQKAKKEI